MTKPIAPLNAAQLTVMLTRFAESLEAEARQVDTTLSDGSLFASAVRREIHREVQIAVANAHRATARLLTDAIAGVHRDLAELNNGGPPSPPAPEPVITRAVCWTVGTTGHIHRRLVIGRRQIEILSKDNLGDPTWVGVSQLAGAGDHPDTLSAFNLFERALTVGIKTANGYINIGNVDHNGTWTDPT